MSHLIPATSFRKETDDPLAAAALALALFAALALLPTARADGDPASDYLLTRSTFVPPDLGIPAADAARLAQTVALARAAGYPIRVALIGSAYDLGSVASVYRRPKFYARFLGKELTLVYHGRLLVVMPNGYGVSRAGNALPASSRFSTGCPRRARAARSSRRPGSPVCAHWRTQPECGLRRRRRRPEQAVARARSCGAWEPPLRRSRLAGLGFLALRPRPSQGRTQPTRVR